MSAFSFFADPVMALPGVFITGLGRQSQSLGVFMRRHWRHVVARLSPFSFLVFAGGVMADTSSSF